ncbi:MAG: alpha/beta fold hydrolase [Myxococcota bacterium]
MTRLRRIAYGLIIFALVLGAAPCVVSTIEQSGSLTEARADLGATLVNLKDGRTHYESAGPGSTRCVVLIHGASGPMSVWDKTVPALTARGRKVVRYHLYGRGLSDRPDGRHDLALYRRQLSGLLTELGCSGSADLVGSSMGSIIASDFAMANPGRVDRVVLIGPAGFPIEASPAASLLQVSLVGEYAMAVIGGPMLKRHNRKYYAEPERWPEAAVDFAAQLRYPGYKRAILSTMRHMPVSEYTDGYRALGRSKTPVVLIWGRHDATFPFSHFDEAKRLLAPIEAHAIADAAHLPQYEQPDAVNAILVRVLGSPLR